MVMLASAFVLAASFQGEPTSRPTRHPIAVLYAGELGTPRAQDFVRFLEERFVKVGTIASGELIASGAAGYDVVVADGTTEMTGNRLTMAGCTKLEFPPEWTKPTVLIASAGRSVEKTTKIGWL